jgi:pimeloyl-ACP methyl ester carboxylesterase
MTTVPITQVTGGVAGMAATYAHIRTLAAGFDAAGDRMRGWAAAGGRTLTDPDLVESAVLSPLTFAEAEEKVLGATTGTHGVLVESVVYEADAVLLRATVDAFVECDRLVRQSFRVLDYLAGHAVGYALAQDAPYLLVGGYLALRLDPGLPGDLEHGVEEHPQAVQHLVDGSGGLLDGLLAGLPPAGMVGSAFHPSTGDAAATLGALYRAEGPARVIRRGDLSVPLGNHQPDSLAGVIHHLRQTNDLSPADRPGDQGTIEIQTVREPDGSVRHIVYLPGTDDLSTTPLSQDGDVRDLATNLDLIADHDTTYQQGIEEAMRRAGIGPDDPVLLVGHSQGGMEAAAMLGNGSPFRVTSVVTAGAPTAQVHGFPPGSHVLSLENQGDVVPLLDGADNPDSVQQVTVRFDDHGSSIADSHDLRHYVRGARAADASTDRSVRAELASLRAHGFLGSGGTASSQVFQVTR